MSYHELKVKEVTARKEHSCEWCGEKTAVGEKYVNRVYIYEGEFNNGHMHLDCAEAMNKSDSEYIQDGFFPGHAKRGEVIK